MQPGPKADDNIPRESLSQADKDDYQKWATSTFLERSKFFAKGCIPWEVMPEAEKREIMQILRAMLPDSL